MKKAFLVLALSFWVGVPSANATKYEGRLVPGVWEQSWTDTLKTSLTDSGLYDHREGQIETLCPGYRKDPAKRELFWRQLMVSLSWKESLHGPENYVHFKKGTNDGLFQINPVLRGYYDCDGYELFDPLMNIRCAVKMAKKLVDRYKSFLTGQKSGMAAYWQPLRATSRLNRKNRAAILAEVTKACKENEIIYRCKSTSSIHMHHDTGVMDEMDLSFNTIDDLGIPADQLDPVDPTIKCKPPTYEIDPAQFLNF